MPKKLEKQLKKEAKAKGLKGKRAEVYIYGSIELENFLRSCFTDKDADMAARKKK